MDTMKWEENVRRVVPYVAGEQPNRPKMNTELRAILITTAPELIQALDAT